MSDEKKKTGEPEPEKEFYNLIRRPSLPVEDDAPQSAGKGQAKQNPPRSVSNVNRALDDRAGKKEERGPKPARTEVEDRTRTLHMEPQHASSSAPQEEREEAYPKRPSRNFQLNLDNELKRIPDYTLDGGQGARIKSRGMRVFMKIMLAIIVIGISVFLSVAILFCAQDMFGVNKPDEVVLVDIPKNAGLSQVADKLQAVGVIRSADLFKVYFKLSKPTGEFQYGTYSLNPSMSYDIIIEELFKYASTKEEVTVTFPEGFTLYQMAQRLESSGVCTARDFLNTVNNMDFGFDFEKDVPGDPLRYNKLEGYLFPDTYNFFKDGNPADVATKMLYNFENKMSEELLAQMEEMGFTLEETLTIASIVQKEAGKSNEMRMVASVYYNRLKNKGVYPNLQADPTRGYAELIEEQMQIIDGITPNEEILNAYDTYEGKGLPPGPICNPGLDAIEATLNPADTDYFYFCNNLDTGEFFYAKTLEEHERNLVKAGLR